uniref:Zn(2)-C6 fungal-type domain-containing protein n=1 Tax=Moniliophthora roreri TaxID=221103 RepID=A0A0W0FVT3_MONRR
MNMPACDQCAEEKAICDVATFLPQREGKSCKRCAENHLPCSFVQERRKATPVATRPVEVIDLLDDDEPPMPSGSKGKAPENAFPPIDPSENATLIHFLTKEFAAVNRANEALSKANAQLRNEVKELRQEVAAISAGMHELTDDHICIERRLKLSHAKLDYVYNSCLEVEREQSTLKSTLDDGGDDDAQEDHEDSTSSQDGSGDTDEGSADEADKKSVEGGTQA